MELILQIQQFLTWAIDVFLHLDTHLNAWAGSMGPWLYVVLFAIIFCETGLVVTPFLPGDSLLFAIGALSALDGSPIELPVLLAILPLAAFLGDITNYFIGRSIGPKIFKQKKSLFFNREYLIAAQAFYEKHGKKTIIIARFMPIVRTFAPFVAGIGSMRVKSFLSFSVVGGFIWIWLFAIAGYFFGNQPFVKEQFHYVIVAIIVISVLPAVIHGLKSYQARKKA